MFFHVIHDPNVTGEEGSSYLATTIISEITQIWNLIYLFPPILSFDLIVT